MQKFFIRAMAVWLLISTLIITVLNFSHKANFAKIMMGWGLIILWVVIGGSLMYRYRDRFKLIFEKLPTRWTLKFFIFCVLLALLEEAIATFLTNLAPVFGVPFGEAYITVSSNFFQVVLHHSVIIFIPLFAAWTWLLKKYDFSANQAFWLFGFTGALAEAISFGTLAEFGLWIFVYGLMIYLPAYCVPAARYAKPVRIYHYPIVFLASIFSLVLLFVVAFFWNIAGLPSLPNFGPDFIE
jgi:hypothetical protein